MEALPGRDEIRFAVTPTDAANAGAGEREDGFALVGGGRVRSRAESPRVPRMLSGGMTLRWDPEGTARGRIGLLHGVTASSRTWWRVGPELARQGWQVVAVDLSGHGGMPKLAKPLDLETLVADAAVTLDGPVDVLIGHSLGGVVAAALGAWRPETARMLILEDPPGSRRRGQDGVAFVNSILADAELARTDPAELARRKGAANPSWARVDVENSVHGIGIADIPSIVDGLRGPLQWRLAELVRRARVPVYVIAAPDSGNSALRGEDRTAMQALLEPENFVVLEGGHNVHRDLPDQWLASVMKFTEISI